MTKNMNDNRPYFIAGAGIAAADIKDEGTRAKVYAALKEAGANADTLASKAPGYADLRDGYLTEWQGADFAAAFASNNGKVVMAGKVLDAVTGSMVPVEKTRQEWQNQLGSKVTKAREAYIKWLGAVIKADSRMTDADIPDGAGAGAGGTAKSFKDLCGDDLQKLWNRIMKDQAGDAPTLSVDHAAMLGFVKAAADCINAKMKNPPLPK